MFGKTITQDRVVGSDDQYGDSMVRPQTSANGDSISGIRSQFSRKAVIRGSRNARLQKGCSVLVATLIVLGGAISDLGGGASDLPSRPRRAQMRLAELGLASWYGHPYHGRQAANGERYDMNQLTAAHRSLPFGTRVLVCNLDNSRTVEVKITDRGPFVEGRLIDLSRAAARILGFQRAGLARVRMEVLSEEGVSDTAE